jgi:hypothetical protein
MPAHFFAEPEGVFPASWQRRSNGSFRKDVIEAAEIYFSALDDIEDGTERGVEAFKAMQDMQ